MQVPLEVAYRDIDRHERLDALIAEQAAKLDRLCDHLDSCRVAVERPIRHPRSGSGYRVRIELRVPPGHELTVTREPGEGDLHDPVDKVVREAFSAAARRLEKVTAKQRGDVKRHPEQEVQALVDRLVADHGFLRTPDGREIYFHRNSVLGPGFEALREGTGVAFSEEEGDEGPQATSVRIVEHRAERTYPRVEE